MITVDNWLLDRVFQPIADRVADRVTPFQLARECLQAALAFVLVRAVLTFMESYNAAVLVFPGILLLLGVLFWHGTFRQEDAAKEGMVNPNRINLLPARLLVVIMMIPMAVVYLFVDSTLDDFLFLAEAVAWFGFYYFVSCRKNPPSRQHASQWAEA